MGRYARVLSVIFEVLLTSIDYCWVDIKWVDKRVWYQKNVGRVLPLLGKQEGGERS